MKKVMGTRITINMIETENTVPALKVVNDITNALDECIYQVFDLDGTGNNKCLNCSCK